MKEMELKQNQLFEEALHFATNCHSGQVRKGTKIPFILHPLEVAQILHRMGADVNLMIAGLLHDVVEDTDTEIDEIREHFGDDVAALVAGHTEDKSRTWRERKQTEMDEALTADLRMKKLLLADKLANARSMQKDYRALGEKLWDRFNAGAEKQAWYYGGMVTALEDLEHQPETGEFYHEFRCICKDLFGEK